MAGSSSPEAQSCPNMLHGNRASQPTSKPLKETREATFSPKDAPLAQLDRTRRNGTPLPRCQAGFLSMWTWNALERWDIGAACWLWDGPSQAQSCLLSGTHCSHLSSCGHPPLLLCGLPILLPTVFLMPPHSAKWLQIQILTTGNADQHSDPLWKDPTLQPIFSDISAWCIKKKVCEFNIYQYSMNTLWNN